MLKKGILISILFFQFVLKFYFLCFSVSLTISLTCSNILLITATEAFDDDGLPHTLEHLVFLGSEKYPYKVYFFHVFLCLVRKQCKVNIIFLQMQLFNIIFSTLCERFQLNFYCVYINTLIKYLLVLSLIICHISKIGNTQVLMLS